MLKCKLLSRTKNNGVYYEAHHIIPVCFGGLGDGRNLKHPNIVLLTPKEHYIAHLLLVAIYPDSACMLKALWNMSSVGSDLRYKPSARTFHRIREEYAKNIRGEKASFYGKKHSKESLLKISIASKGRKPNLGKKLSDETKKKISKSHMGKTITDESKKKIQKALSGGNHYNAIPVICTKTGKIFGSGKELSEFTKIPFSTIRRWLNGYTKSPANFHYKRQQLAYDQM